MAAVLRRPTTLKDVIELGEQLRDHRIRVQDLLCDTDSDDPYLDEAGAERRILRQVDELKLRHRQRLKALKDFG